MGGKRKSKKRVLKKEKSSVARIFSCPFCDQAKSVECRLNKKDQIGTLHCRICDVKYQSSINYLTEPIDVYAEWIDECEKHNADPNVVPPHEQQRRAARHAAETGDVVDEDGTGAGGPSPSPPPRLDNKRSKQKEGKHKKSSVVGKNGKEAAAGSIKKRKQRDDFENGVGEATAMVNSNGVAKRLKITMKDPEENEDDEADTAAAMAAAANTAAARAAADDDDQAEAEHDLSTVGTEGDHGEENDTNEAAIAAEADDGGSLIEADAAAAEFAQSNEDGLAATTDPTTSNTMPTAVAS